MSVKLPVTSMVQAKARVATQVNFTGIFTIKIAVRNVSEKPKQKLELSSSFRRDQIYLIL
jgi:hypothetical protein